MSQEAVNTGIPGETQFFYWQVNLFILRWNNNNHFKQSCRVWLQNSSFGKNIISYEEILGDSKTAAADKKTNCFKWLFPQHMEATFTLWHHNGKTMQILLNKKWEHLLQPKPNISHILAATEEKVSEMFPDPWGSFTHCSALCSPILSTCPSDALGNSKVC